MIDSKKIENLIRQMKNTLPRGIRDLGNNVEKKIRPVLQNQFTRMNLINREEFDIQVQILLNVREKINQLELRIQSLEDCIKKDRELITSSNIDTGIPEELIKASEEIK